MRATAGWERVRQHFLATGKAEHVLEKRCEKVEAFIRKAFEDCGPVLEAAALVAVGGFGRQELFPYSDVDLIVLAGGAELAEESSAAVADFIRGLWDAGLRPAHSVRTAGECCSLEAANAELSISLLDARFVAGNVTAWRTLEKRLDSFFHNRRQGVAAELARLVRLRHARYQNTIHHLEPNIKDSPGGLRDIHLLAWWEKLGIEPPGKEDLPQIEEAARLAATLRCFLHYRSGRDDNVLSFQAQEEFTASGLVPISHTEDWMRKYFLNARLIHRLAVGRLEAVEARASKLLEEFRGWRARLTTSEFTVARNRVYLKNPGRLKTDPGLFLRLFRFAGLHRVLPALETERRLAEHRQALEDYCRQSGQIWGALHEILRLPHAGFALRCLHESGMLGLVFPEWRYAEGLVVRDFHHRYTVDEHSLLALERLDSIGSAQEPRPDRLAELFETQEDPAALRLALLFHDAGKVQGWAHHPQISARMATDALRRLEAPESLSRQVAFLIEKHLVLASAMAGRDLHDPVTARHLADEVETLENLSALTLMTAADISAVYPGALNAYRLEQLWRAHVVTHAELTRGLEADRIQDARTDAPEKAAFLLGFPVRYVRTHGEQEIDDHVILAREAAARGVGLRIRHEPAAYRLDVVTPDRPALVAALSAALAGFGLHILKAEAFANRQGLALTTFLFSDPSRSLDLNPSELERLHVTLERVVLGKIHPETLLKGRLRKPPAPGQEVRCNVAWNNSASEHSTLIEVSAGGRPGLLYDLSNSIARAGGNIGVVLIEAEGRRARAVFYISEAGAKLSDQAADRLCARLLQAAKS